MCMHRGCRYSLRTEQHTLGARQLHMLQLLGPWGRSHDGTGVRQASRRPSCTAEVRPGSGDGWSGGPAKTGEQGARLGTCARSAGGAVGLHQGVWRTGMQSQVHAQRAAVITGPTRQAGRAPPPSHPWEPHLRGLASCSPRSVPTSRRGSTSALPASPTCAIQPSRGPS